MIVGTATRYLAGRGAVQTVYWVRDPSGEKMVKYTRMLNFADKKAAAEIISSNGAIFNQNRQRLLTSSATVSDRRSFHTTPPLLR